MKLTTNIEQQVASRMSAMIEELEGVGWKRPMIHAILHNVTDFLAENDKPAPKLDMSRIIELFKAAKINGIKYPSFRVNDLKLNLAPKDGKNPGAVYVMRHDEYQGKVTAGGVFMSIKTRYNPEIREQLELISRDPLEEASAHGIRTGQCSCCGRTLTNQESIDRGIGPICASKWGLL